jgi:hypothetical protein
LSLPFALFIHNKPNSQLKRKVGLDLVKVKVEDLRITLNLGGTPGPVKPEMS